MALTQKSFEEPLLSRQQAAVCRDIARAAQLSEAHGLMDKITATVRPASVSSSDEKTLAELNAMKNIQLYLQAEITRVLMQIKLPAAPVTKTKA